MFRIRTWASLTMFALACDPQPDADTRQAPDAAVTTSTATSAERSTGAPSHAENSTQGLSTTSLAPQATNASNANAATSEQNTLVESTSNASLSTDGGNITIDWREPTPDASDLTADAALKGDAGAQLEISCDPRQLVCRRAAPTCDYGFVPRIVNGCYGECVAVDTCVCDGPDACPNQDRYTCNNSRQRCTPYLN